MIGRAARSTLARDALLVLAVGAAYYLGARIGFVLRFPPAITSVIWPPNALLTAALLLTAPSRWWLCLAAALPAHLLVESQAGFAPGFIATLFLTNSLEALVAAGAVRLWSDDPERFDTLQRALAFVGGAVLLGPLVSTFPDAAAVHHFQGEPFGAVCLRRLLSNSLSQLALVPSAVILVRDGSRWLRRATRRQHLDAVLLALGLVALGGLVFGDYQRHASFLPGAPYTALPVLMPLLILAAVRFGPAGASLALLTTALLAIGSALSGGTPLTGLPAEESVTALQVFLVVVGVPLLLVSALMKERQQIAETLRERLRFEATLSQLSGAFVHLPSDRMHLEFEAWLERVARFFGLDWAGLWQLTGDTEAFVPVAWWAGPGVERTPSRMERDRFRWSADQLLRQEPIVWSSPDGVPDSATEIERLKLSGVRSLLALPLVAGGEVIGCFALLSLSKPKHWPDELVRNCRLIAEVLAGALARKLGEDALRAGETMKSAVLGSLTSQVAVLDREGVIIAVNESWTRFGLENAASASDVTGAGASYLEICRRAAATGDQPSREALAGIEDVLARRRPSFGQDYGCPSRRGERWFHMTAVPLERPEGGAVVSHTDISERRLAEMEAERSRQELAHAARVFTLGEMATALAHELNQPLAAILSNAQATLRAAPASAEEVEEVLRDIAQDAARGGQIIARVRELARRGESRLQRLDLNATIRRVEPLLRPATLEVGADLAFELEAALPAVRADAVQVQQVVLNLVRNGLEAVREMPLGGRSIGIRTCRDGDWAVTEVTDTGPAVEDAVLARLFEPFHTTKASGLGLGLSISRSIVEAHGGTIGAKRSAKGGVAVRFKLPLFVEREAR